MHLTFEPKFTGQRQWTQIIIGFKSRNQGPLLMVIREEARLSEDGGIHCDWAEVLWSSDHLWRKPLYWLRSLLKKRG